MSKSYNTFVENGYILDIVMLMYNLLEYSDSYSMTLKSLWKYYVDEVNDTANENNASVNKINNDKTRTSKSFEHKTKTISTPLQHQQHLEQL